MNQLSLELSENVGHDGSLIKKQSLELRQLVIAPLLNKDWTQTDSKLNKKR